jgi:hypothetical protein
MIQRIQTVWLLLAMGCAVALLYFPFWQLSGGIDTGMDSIGAGTHFYLLGFPPVLFITHALAIFSYKKRKRQLRLCGINIMLFILFFIAAIVIVQVENNLFGNFQIADFKPGAILPLIGILFNLMARSGIKKDEEVIRSMDRLR